MTTPEQQVPQYVWQSVADAPLPRPASPATPTAAGQEPEGYREAWDRWAAAVDRGADMDELRPLWAAVNATLDRAEQIRVLTSGYTGPDCEIPARPFESPAEAQQDDELDALWSVDVTEGALGSLTERVLRWTVYLDVPVSGRVAFEDDVRRLAAWTGGDR